MLQKIINFLKNHIHLHSVELRHERVVKRKYSLVDHCRKTSRTNLHTFIQQPANLCSLTIKTAFNELGFYLDLWISPWEKKIVLLGVFVSYLEWENTRNLSILLGQEIWTLIYDTWESQIKVLGYISQKNSSLNHTKLSAVSYVFYSQ